MARTKPILGMVKLQLDAGGANPGKVGQALGPYGANIMAFCKAYNEATGRQRGTVVPVEITIYEDRSFEFVTRTPPTSRLLAAAAGIERGAARPHAEEAGVVTRAQLADVARTKLPDLTTDDLEQAMKIVAGTARSMGITVKE
jgi:large subunit ribosomal protein L11